MLVRETKVADARASKLNITSQPHIIIKTSFAVTFTGVMFIV